MRDTQYVNEKTIKNVFIQQLKIWMESVDSAKLLSFLSLYERQYAAAIEFKISWIDASHFWKPAWF